MPRLLRSAFFWIANLEMSFVALAVALSVLSERALPLALGVIAFFCFIRWLAYGHLTVRTAADWSIAALLLMLPVTLWATAKPSITWPQVLRLLVGVGFYYAIVNWATSPKRVRRLAFGTVLAALAFALGGTVSTRWPVYRNKLPFLPISFYEYLPTLISDTINPNVMGGILVFLLPVALAIGLFSWQHLSLFERLLTSVALTLTGGVLLLTQSRGALFALACVLVILGLLRWRWGWLLLPFAILAALMTVKVLSLATVLDILTADDTLSGFEGRLHTWSRALYLIQLFPLTGVGMGLFAPVADLLYPPFLSNPGEVPHAHNIFLQVAVDLGIAGLIAWLTTLIIVLSTSWQLYRAGRQHNDEWVAGLGAGLLCSQVALMIHGLVDAVLWGMVRPSPIVWGVWGLTIAAWRVIK
jgi:putative inorganic carbon (HCO3(-)) transporter